MWCAQARPGAAGAGFWRRDSEARSALCRRQTGALTGSGPKERVQIPGALRGPSFPVLSGGKGGPFLSHGTSRSPSRSCRIWPGRFPLQVQGV